MNNHVPPLRSSLSPLPSSDPLVPKSKKLSLYLPLLGLLLFLLSGIFFLYIPMKVHGSDNTLFKNDQTYFSEKVTYLFRDPKVGEVVTFISAENPNLLYTGVIVDQSAIDGSTSYTIVNKSNTTSPFIVSVDSIHARVYFPKLVIPTSPIDLLPSLTPTPTMTPTQSPTPLPPSPKPTRRPTLLPTSTPTQSPSESSVTSTTTSTSNAVSCQIVARALSEGVPVTYNLVYSATYSGGNDYVTAVQWDFNGDGNWDTDASITNGNVNYTYSTPGIFSIRMRIQTNSGSSVECSTTIGVQPH